ncbi:MAG: hypothetical protein K0S58_885 [Nitrospira sp.]|jgi:hypothetical protein|nr:hypothetical protein [Nitrospira sp.]
MHFSDELLPTAGSNRFSQSAPLPDEVLFALPLVGNIEKPILA